MSSGGAGSNPTEPTRLVPVASLTIGDSPRRGGADPEHVRLLAESEQPLPPIVVHRATGRVIDGMHRLEVAVLRGESEIAVRYFDGPERDAFVLAVTTNTQHGLPLSFADRAAAAERIIGSHPEWSDRRIARVTGISATSVAGLRLLDDDTGTGPVGPGAPPPVRIGADGRRRPPNSSPDGRIRIAELIEQNPDASLRDIARAAAASVSTVTDVRRRLGRGEDPVLPSQRRAAAGEPMNPPAPRRPTPPTTRDDLEVLQDLQRDPSLRFSEPGRALLRILHATVASAARWPELVHTVPGHQAQMVAELAENCAEQWRELAESVRSRAATERHTD